VHCSAASGKVPRTVGRCLAQVSPISHRHHGAVSQCLYVSPAAQRTPADTRPGRSGPGQSAPPRSAAPPPYNTTAPPPPGPSAPGVRAGGGRGLKAIAHVWRYPSRWGTGVAGERKSEMLVHSRGVRTMAPPAWSKWPEWCQMPSSSCASSCPHRAAFSNHASDSAAASAAACVAPSAASLSLYAKSPPPPARTVRRRTQVPVQMLLRRLD
jgi:hypothetical protein